MITGKITLYKPIIPSYSAPNYAYSTLYQGLKVGDKVHYKTITNLKAEDIGKIITIVKEQEKPFYIEWDDKSQSNHSRSEIQLAPTPHDISNNDELSWYNYD